MTHWKTTVFGALAAACVALQAYSGHDWKGYVTAAALAAFGFVSKDFNKQ